MPKSRIILIVAFLVYTISAIFNNGFYHYDEHYQIIEFAELKAGNNTSADMAWEYKAQIRPTLQPTIVYMLLSAMRLIGISDRYILMIILRVLTGLLAISVISYFLKKTRQFVIPELITWYAILSYFLWFLPFINVRFSSETLSGLAFMLCIGLYYSGNTHKFLLMGCLIALSFLFRFQTAFMSLGLLVWLLAIQKTSIKNFAPIFTGALLMLFAGFAIDCWFYATPTLTFYNYYLTNIVDGIASEFGVSPWHYYFTALAQSCISPLGIIIWLCFLNQLVFNPKNFVSWVIVPFLAIHILTPHKELRFLFPLANFIPLMVILTVQHIRQISFLTKKKVIIALVPVLALIALVNTAALVTTMLAPADGKGRINITQTIHTNYKKPVTLWVLDIRSPYQPIVAGQKFYDDKNVLSKPFEMNEVNHLSKDTTNLLLLKTNDIGDYKFMLQQFHLKKVRSSVPEWITYVKVFFGYYDASLTLFEISDIKQNES